ncbi:uncharacterized protein MELLADRAFT_105958 [Melampsora larici-populina 98AG31]|uniref:DUF7872 domain-containing protein n=1 Tax=Melampsora larici-populina (strain 98AG31 / pathotype 3-4-7) TaxID=747676 RepID=F4RJW7_MELLP|nr:uncharacterized protein MELLADRAFT_105958 [Melampsora larici-populina 98AG31]EGG07385.1 hypothetical protein MELLADRAFT_105958 [Melampsora larici-populina 98AG31]
MHISQQVQRSTYLSLYFLTSYKTFAFNFKTSPDPNQLTIQPGCDPLPITKATWINLNLDLYLANYPGGHNLTVQEYASSVKANNFKCGISEWCNAGQMCYPVKGRDWYVLLAAQMWNETVNSFYNAIGYTMSLVRASLVEVISGFFPQPNNLKIFSQKTHFEIGALIAGLIGSVFALLPFVIGMPSAIFTWAAGLSFIPSVLVTTAAVTTNYKPAPEVDAFSDWSEIGYILSERQNEIHSVLNKHAQSVLDAGISTPEGLFGSLSGGRFLDVDSFFNPEQVESELKTTTMYLSFDQVFKSMDPCEGPGPDGARQGDDVLSYCKNGTMYNVVRASSGKHPKVINTIPNAQKVTSKFSLTAEQITQTSVECASNGGQQNSTLPSANGLPKCLISLPVCDCRLDIVKANRKKLGTVRACRKAGVKI